jgi:flap endonuclease-1
MMKHGLRPIWVFDGKPPVLKGGELAKRKKAKKAALDKLEEAAEVGDEVEVAKAVKGTVHVTKKHNEEAKRLLRLMGVPVVEAPTEAEAQCAEIVKKGKAWAVGTEDMDALTFGAPILLRYLTYSEARKKPVVEVYLDKVLEGMGFTMDQFIDLCILMGCDFLPTLKGVGKQRAFDLMKTYGSLEKVIANLDKDKYPVPEDYNFEGVRELFRKPDVTPAEELKLEFTDPDVEGIVEFLCKEKGFNEDRVRASVEKMKKNKTTSVQNRLTSYFGAPQVKASDKTKGKKRDEKKGKESDKKKKKSRFSGK